MKVVDELIVKSQTPMNVMTEKTYIVKPLAVGESPQVVYEKKLIVVRLNQIVWYINGIIEILLIFRFFLKVLGADPYTGFTLLIYVITFPLIALFGGVIDASTSGSFTVEWTTIVAGMVYLCFAWSLVYLFEMLYPLTPKDIESK